MNRRYLRTCQECGAVGAYKDPNTYAPRNDNWRDTLCRKCKSPGLDFGGYEKTKELENYENE